MMIGQNYYFEYPLRPYSLCLAHQYQPYTETVLLYHSPMYFTRASSNKQPYEGIKFKGS